ncbi:MAG: HD domain-containing protein [Chloroflexota bacterium]|nr:HD domain-containing protein [Anaerolineae bacterium]HMM29941.1 HD domain-containing protein [Aggregatilineaceae bacterium]
MRALYRMGQGLRALTTGLLPVDDAQAERILSPELYALYRRMRRSERQHSLRVLRDLRAAGHGDPDLWVAALLHDVGKSRAPFGVAAKTLVVLARAVAPETVRRWGSGSARGWRGPFAVSVQHPVWGAAMVAEAGGSPRAVELIARHQETLDGPPQTETDRLLLALQAVDDAS